MARTTNTVPYTNARRAGRTQPDLIEMRGAAEQTASVGQWGGVARALTMNRTERRARGHRLPIAGGTRRNPIPRSVRRERARRGL